MQPELSDVVNSLEQRLAHFFCKVPDSKYFRLCRPCGLCGNNSALLWYCENSHRQYVNKYVQLCFNKTLFTKMGKGPDLVCELSLPNPSLEDISGFSM